MNNKDLENLLNKYLNINLFKDCSYNGLQVEGKKNINKIITGVTINKELIEKAIAYNADAIIVHHGLIWDNEPKTITGIKKTRLKKILLNNINLYAYHFPLDFNKNIGNNHQLSEILKIKITGYINNKIPYGILLPNLKLNSNSLNKYIKDKLGIHDIHHFNKKKYIDDIKEIAICSGNGQSFINDIIYNEINIFITGEIPELKLDSINESKLNIFMLGHSNTEKGGIFELSNFLIKKYNLDVIFIDI